MEEDADPNREPDSECPFPKAERVFLGAGSLAGQSVRFIALGGIPRLTVGEDCEDGMAEFRRLESARRLSDGGIVATRHRLSVKLVQGTRPRQIWFQFGSAPFSPGAAAEITRHLHNPHVSPGLSPPRPGDRRRSHSRTGKRLGGARVMESGIRSVAKDAPGAEVVDLTAG